jgi:hypothetical protein
MPTQQQHLSQAKHNENFVKSFDLDSTSYLDWVVTGIYYAALHYIESYLALLKKHPRSNEYRERMFQEIKDLTSIYPDFRTLKDYSQGARYDLQKFSKVEVEDIIRNELNDIRNHIIAISKELR